MSGAEAFTETAGTPSPMYSESGIADRFVDKHAGELRYVAEWGQWMSYDGKRWAEEKTLLAFDLIRKLCRELARESNKERKNLLSGKTIAAVERIAKTDRRIAATIDQWDADLWLLNTPDGVVDLKTGKLRAHAPEDYMTKITAVGPAGECPLWEAHLKKVMNGDEALVGFLQRALGYSLTGSIREHALFFAFGSGANGKGTTFETIAHLLGDYSRTAPMETFTWSASSSDRHPTELAMLRGARFVTASETEEGRGWAESKIKNLTGGDRITARFMRQDFFEYDPQFKLWLQGNHKPGLKSTDEAIRRRMNMIPFIVTIPAEERDKELSAKLKGEWSGILSWMIRGCLRWQKDGLKPPEAVTKATDDYLASEDKLELWFKECCESDPAAEGLFTTNMFASFKIWCLENNEKEMSVRRFSQALEGRGTRLGIRKRAELRMKNPKTGEMMRGAGFEGVRWKSADDAKPL